MKFVSKYFVDQTAMSGINAAEDAPASARAIEKNHTITSDAQAIETVEFPFQTSNISSLLLQFPQGISQSPARRRSKRLNKANDLLFDFNFHLEPTREGISPFFLLPCG